MAKKCIAQDLLIVNRLWPIKMVTTRHQICSQKVISDVAIVNSQAIDK